jgi:hypothetical protein
VTIVSVQIYDEEGIIMKRLNSVRQLLGKSKWETRLADWIIATGVGLVGCYRPDFEADGEKSHLAIRLPTVTTVSVLDLFSLLDFS